MTTFHAFLGCSLDGYIALPDGGIDWLTEFAPTGFEEFFAGMDALAMGRATYAVMRDSMPNYYRGTPITVLSRTLPVGPAPDMGRSRVHVCPSLSQLRAEFAEAGVARVYADGGKTVQSFLAAGLLNELTITRVPVLLGDGIPLFGKLPGPRQATLLSSVTTEEGAVQSRYRFSAPQQD